jgi:PAS domain S-box-containing protein
LPVHRGYETIRVVTDGAHLGHGGAQAVLELFEEAQVIAMTIDSGGRITYCNRYLVELSGFSRDELLGADYFALLEPYRPADAADAIFQSMMRGDTGPFGETVLRTRHGDERVISWSDTLIRADDGTVRGVISIGQDVTERRLAQARLNSLAEEHAALRRVATLVAKHRPGDEILDAVTEEVGRLLQAQSANTIRFEGDDGGTVVGSWRAAGARTVPTGTTLALDSETAVGLVRRTGRPARVDDYAELVGDHAAMLRATIGIRTGVAAPITAGGRVWGCVTVSGLDERRFPLDAEARLGQFAELVAQGIDNAEVRTQLRESRARIVQAADDARRRIERDLHDGAQQRLVGVALRLRLAREQAGDAARQVIDQAASELAEALEELRELARGIHPTILTDRGLEPALRLVAVRSAVPVDLEAEVLGRLPPPHEAALYFTASEALTNVGRYAQASRVRVRLRRENGHAVVEVVDDGVGGADASTGTGLRFLADRVEALGGFLEVASPPGVGTTVRAGVPIGHG